MREKPDTETERKVAVEVSEAELAIQREIMQAVLCRSALLFATLAKR